MLNYIWIALLLIGFAAAIGRDLSTPPDPTAETRFPTIQKVTNEGIVESARTAVTLAIGLIGIMSLWLGLMRIAEKAGLVEKLALLVRPLMTRLFPDVPTNHPAMGAMVMNISANMLGLANAATPLGLKAMEELNKLNKNVGTATDAMCTFLVINTCNIQIIPATVIAIRASAGSANPTEILGPVIVATTISMAVGITVVKALAKLRIYKRQATNSAPDPGE
jgi:spore maturation protein A